MAGKYGPLFNHLHGSQKSSIRLTFRQIERMLGTSLPGSARRYSAWWANDGTSHSHARSWISAGFKTREVDLGSETVTFLRLGPASGRIEPKDSEGGSSRPNKSHMTDQPVDDSNDSPSLLLKGQPGSRQDIKDLRILVVSSCTAKKTVTASQIPSLNDFRNPDRLKRLQSTLEQYLRPAGEMYAGTQHVRMMAGVRQLRDWYGPDSVDVKIISAGYGLVDEQRLIAPYNATFSDLSRSDARAWARQLGIASAVRSAIATYPLVVFLLGVNYLNSIEPPVHPNPNQRIVFFANPAPELQLPGVVVIPPDGRYPGNHIGRKGFMFEMLAHAISCEGQTLWDRICEDQSTQTINLALEKN